jgi:hypothetical protein
MHKKQKIEKYLKLEKVDESAASVHWWGNYKYEISGLDYWKAMVNDGKSIVPVYEKFYETFNPDIFCLNEGTPKYYKDALITKENGSEYVEFQDKYLDLKKLDRAWSEDASKKKEKRLRDYDYYFESDLKKPKPDLSSKKSIDEYVKKYLYKECDLIIELGYTDHIKEISEKYGSTEFITVNMPTFMDLTFTYSLGFERAMTAFAEYPEGVGYYFKKCIPVTLEWAKAYKKAGLHGLAVCISPPGIDLISPKTHKDLIFPYEKEMFSGIKDIGLYPICSFISNIMPYIEDMGNLGVSSLQVDESRKDYIVDVVEITKILGEKMCIFGNMDSQNMLYFGKREDIRKEVDRQSKAKKYGNFIFRTGSPLIPGTPQENIHEFLDYAKSIKM